MTDVYLYQGPVGAVTKRIVKGEYGLYLKRKGNVVHAFSCVLLFYSRS